MPSRIIDFFLALYTGGILERIGYVRVSSFDQNPERQLEQVRVDKLLRPPDVVMPRKAPSTCCNARVWIVALLIVALLLFSWWLFLLDREPTSTEMTLAYRKHVVLASGDQSAEGQLNLRKRLEAIEFVKQHCDHLGRKQYRCTAMILVTGNLDEIPRGAGNAIYRRDRKGWQFERIAAS